LASQSHDPELIRRGFGLFGAQDCVHTLDLAPKAVAEIGMHVERPPLNREGAPDPTPAGAGVGETPRPASSAPDAVRHHDQKIARGARSATDDLVAAAPAASGPAMIWRYRRDEVSK
jgi:hypothetical protein